MYPILIALAALAGTLLQTLEALGQLSNSPDADTFRTIDAWKNEVPRYRPIKRRRHRSTLREIRRDHPAAWRAYRRLWLILLSWSLLTVAAAGATIDALT